MSAKFVYNLSDENPDLHKHIGCMNGFFQLFDRHHFFGAGRRTVGQTPKRLSSGPNGDTGAQPKIVSQKTREKSRKAMKEKQRISTESSRTSFSSSSCSSSVSSLECSKVSQHGQASISQANVPEVHARNSPVFQPNASLQSQQSSDLRDVVKDSIYREPRGLSVKTASKGGGGGQTLKYFDSPRPLQHPKSVSPKVLGLKESFSVLHKLGETPCKSHSLSSSGIDVPRFSWDGRESRDMLKSTIKAKELPRLSLDSRAGSIRGSTTDMKSNYLLEALKKRNGNADNFQNQEQEPRSHTRTSSVVAKLMGLETLSDHISTNGIETRQIKTDSDVKNDPFSASSRTSSDIRQNHISGSPRAPHKEPLSPKLNAGLIKKPTANIKSPIELAPWKQPDGSRGSHIPCSKTRITPTKAPNSSLSVYGEIEKRLAQLEFKKSGKDLRALKQILDAMQKTNVILETRNEASNFVFQTNNISYVDPNSVSPSLRNRQRNSCISTETKGTASPKSSKSPIVIMKPTKIIGNASSPATSWRQIGDSDMKESADKQIARYLTPITNHPRDPSNQSFCSGGKDNCSRPVRSAQTSKKPQSTSRVTNNSGKASGTVNLRKQQRKIGFEKRTRPKTPSSDSTRTRRQPNRQLTESDSQLRKPRAKCSNMQPSDDELSEISSDMRDSCNQGNASSLQSESNISMVSQIDEEVSSTYKPDKINSSFIQQPHWRQNSPVARSNKNGSTAEPAMSSSEQPSPVSVLDAEFYVDELPSPIKRISIVFQDDDAPNTDEVECKHMVLSHTSSTLNSSFSSVVEHKKVETIKPLFENLKQMLSVQERSISDKITPVFDSTNPDHQYISELLLASGLLKDFESSFMAIHLHPARYPINPDLFIVLEQAKASKMQLNDECSIKRITRSDTNDIIQRQLIFDVVNEILVDKLTLHGSSKKWLSPNVPVNKRPGGQQLLEELCTEVDRLQGINSNCNIDSENDCLSNIFLADIMHQSMHWIAHPGEIPGLVLDIERLIFKDLISEIVTSEAIGLQGQSAGYRRQLFPK